MPPTPYIFVRGAHVQAQLASLRDEAGQLLFASIDVVVGDGIMPLYKQARLLRRGPR